MTNRMRLYLPLLLLLLNILPSATVVAQAIPQRTFLPSVANSFEPLPPSELRPAPYDVDSRNLVIRIQDLAHANNYDYELTQDEAIEITEGLRHNLYRWRSG